MQVPKILSRYRETIDSGLRSTLDKGDLPLLGMLRYHMGWVDDEFRPVSAVAGKAVRPTLCLFACEAAGGDWHLALPAAISLELIHNFSLIHDDIQDGDTQRHHRPTLWFRWGHSHGLNAGSALHMLANQALDNADTVGLSPEAILRSTGTLTKACLEMIEGQTLDMAFESRPRVSTAEYLIMIEKKTGALLQGSLSAGAGIASMDPLLLTEMGRFGHALGRLFQVRDDMLGVWGDATETGKPAASDLHRRKKSLPVVYTLEHAGKDESAQRFTALYRTRESLSEADVSILLAVMEHVGARHFCQHLAEEEAAKARAALAAMPIAPWAKEQAADLVTFLLERGF